MCVCVCVCVCACVCVHVQNWMDSREQIYFELNSSCLIYTGVCSAFLLLLLLFIYFIIYLFFK